LKAVRRKVAMIHQQFHLVGRLPVERNILSGAVAELSLWQIWSNRPPVALREKAARLCGQVGLEPKHFQRRSSALSGGQQQRVGIARAFILDPEVVLADEPVASLDPETSREVLGILREAARKRGTTVICSLHQVDLAREFADRIIGMRAGQVHCDVAAENFNDELLGSLYNNGSAEAIREASPSDV
jgi:phosphonate transport system ATP-binding protein